MTIIKRNDGVTFIMQAYREHLQLKNKRQLAQEIELLSTQHGQFINMMRRADSTLEVAMSQKPGYLLGELVWDFFARVDNLIFCEAIADSANCLLVIIRDGSVYLDKRLVSGEIRDEMMPIIADDRSYEVYTFGDVPLRDTDTFGDATFKLPKKIVAKFNHLTQSVFERLLVSPEFELQPLPTILRSRYLRDNRLALTLVAVLVVMGGGWWFLGSSTPQQSVTQLQQLPQSLQSYQVALTSPTPSAVIDELAEKIDQLYLIPGWKAATITFSGDKFQVEMQAQGGNLWYLTDWAKQHYYDLRMTPRGAELTLKSHLKNRQLQQHYPDSKTVLAEFMQRLSEVLTADAIHVQSSRQQGVMQETRFTLDLKELSPDLLDLVGRELEDLPLSLSSVHLRLKDGLIDGQIELSLWGKG